MCLQSFLYRQLQNTQTPALGLAVPRCARSDAFHPAVCRGHFYLFAGPSPYKALVKCICAIHNVAASCCYSRAWARTSAVCRLLPWHVFFFFYYELLNTICVSRSIALYVWCGT